MITPEPPAGSEHYREGWRHGYEQAAIDRERSADAVRLVPDTGQARETARHREGPGAGWPRVAGRCPGCNRASLFLAAGEHVTCSHLDCPAPCAADDLLHPVAPSGDTVQAPDVTALRKRLDDLDEAYFARGYTRRYGSHAQIHTSEVRALLDTDTTRETGRG